MKIGINQMVINEQTADHNVKDTIICEVGEICQDKTLYTLSQSDTDTRKSAINRLGEQTGYFFHTIETASEIYCGILLYRYFMADIPNELQEVRHFLLAQFGIDYDRSNHVGSWRDLSDKYFQELVTYLRTGIPTNHQHNYFVRQEHDFPRIVGSFGEITQDDIARINCVLLDCRFLRLREILFLYNSSFSDCTQVQLREYLALLKTHKSDLERCNVESTNLNTAFEGFKEMLKNVGNCSMTKYEFYMFELIYILILHYERHPSIIISELIQSSANEVNMNNVANVVFDAMLRRYGGSDDDKFYIEDLLFKRYTIDLSNTRISI